MNIGESIRLGGTYKLFPALLAISDRLDRPVIVTEIFLDSGGIEMVKFEPGTYAGNAYGYENAKRFKAIFDRVDNDEEQR